MNKTTISIIGLGGVGGYFGFKLAKTFSQDVDVVINFVARDGTYKKVQADGLKLLSHEYPSDPVRPRNVFSLDEIPDSNIYVVAVKGYDLIGVCWKLESKVSDGTIILPLMNGLDINDRIRAIIKNGFVLPSCVYVASHISEKGIIKHAGNPGKIIVGADPMHNSTGGESLLKLFEKANIDIAFKEDATKDIWTKFLFIASVGLVSARYNKSIGQVIHGVATRELARKIMQEIIALAEAKGIELESDAIDKTFHKAASFPFDTPTSLQLDIQNRHQKNELDLFAGTIIKLGNEHNISTSTTSLLLQEISLR